MTQFVDPVHLRQVLVQYYSDSELHMMCFDLGIDYESLGGRGKSEQATKLVAYAQRKNRINDIANYVRRTRQFVELKTADTAFPMLEDAASPASGPTQVTYVMGDQVGGDKVGGDKVAGGKQVQHYTETGPTINIGGSVVGSAIGGGEVHAQNIAGRDMQINAAPQNRDAFVQQLQELKTLVEQAIANGELGKEEGETAVSDLQTVLDETAKPAPRATRIKRRLEDVTEVIGAAVKTGTAVLAATPIITKLIQAVSRIF